MRRRYESRPNHARLFRNTAKRESWQSDFRGKIQLQDGIVYTVGITMRKTFAGEEFLSLYLRPDSPLQQKIKSRGGLPPLAPI
jgi:hypothetical protein